MSTKNIPGESIPGDPAPESRFTKPSKTCPHPEYWHSTDWHSTEMEVSEMIAGLIRGIQPEHCVETGTGFGQTTLAIEQALRRNGHGRLVTFETVQQRAMEVARKVDPAITLIITGPVQSYRPDCGLDFCFFDSDPTHRVAEFMYLNKWMRPGSLVAFHDTAPERAYDLHKHIWTSLSHFIRIIRLPTPRGITLGEVI